MANNAKMNFDNNRYLYTNGLHPLNGLGTGDVDTGIRYISATGSDTADGLTSANSMVDDRQGQRRDVNLGHASSV